ncbi:hypothetical protein Y032_0122g1096 [Ancylostoma ceylanicum]|uniref:Uncharacterized protein n=1 Tax=Ancylostoma ceylanicum TaxID=53326 RepID=A0A016TA19_9BILA|nr:hypothetical protein Y032_0122g1096 [Ancylostoma ceylanicum]
MVYLCLASYESSREEGTLDGSKSKQGVHYSDVNKYFPSVRVFLRFARSFKCKAITIYMDSKAEEIARAVREEPATTKFSCELLRIYTNDPGMVMLFSRFLQPGCGLAVNDNISVFPMFLEDSETFLGKDFFNLNQIYKLQSLTTGEMTEINDEQVVQLRCHTLRIGGRFITSSGINRIIKVPIMLRKSVQRIPNGHRQGAGQRRGHSGCLLHRGSRPAGQRHGANRYVFISRCLARCSRQPECPRLFQQWFEGCRDISHILLFGVQALVEDEVFHGFEKQALSREQLLEIEANEDRWRSYDNHPRGYYGLWNSSGTMLVVICGERYCSLIKGDPGSYRYSPLLWGYSILPPVVDYGSGVQ